MKPEDEDDLQRLTEAVTNLNQALINSNRRTALLERIVRWGVLGLGAVVAVVALVVNDAIDNAYATEVQDVQQSADSVIQALENINRNLMVFGQMGHLMNTGFEEAAKREGIQSAIKKYMEDHPEVNEEQALMGLAGGVMADAFVIMHRIGRDSDLIHPLITEQNISEAMKIISHELHMMNVALAAVPHMAANMNVMGHSMGKMGSWMPWAP